MNFLRYGFCHYVTFTGRDSRPTYWGFIISTHLILILLLLPLFHTLITSMEEFLKQPEMVQLLLSAGNGNEAAMAELQEQANDFVISIEYPALTSIATLAAFLWSVSIMLPTMSATVRRLRDAGQSPLWVIAPLLSCIPLLGGLFGLLSLVTMILCLLPTAKIQTPEVSAVSHDEDNQAPQP